MPTLICLCFLVKHFYFHSIVQIYRCKLQSVVMFNIHPNVWLISRVESESVRYSSPSLANIAVDWKTSLISIFKTQLWTHTNFIELLVLIVLNYEEDIYISKCLYSLTCPYGHLRRPRQIFLYFITGLGGHLLSAASGHNIFVPNGHIFCVRRSIWPHMGFS